MALHDLPYHIDSMFELMMAAKYDPEFEGNREETIEACKNTIESLLGEAENKAVYFTKKIKNLDADVKAMKEEEKRLKARRQTAENQIEDVKSYLMLFMDELQTQKYKAGTYTLSFRHTESVALDCPIDDLPDEFKRVTVVENKTAIKEAMEDGTLPEGIAHMTQNRSLMIR